MPKLTDDQINARLPKLQGWSRHGDALTRFSEEYQEDLYRRTLAMLSKIPQWRGTTPWILVDFRSPRRLSSSD